MRPATRASAWCRRLLLCAAFAGGPVPAAEPRLGDLPQGAVSMSETGDVAAEICRTHLFDPAAAAIELPAGHRLLSAAELAATDGAIAALLGRQPRIGGHAVGSLCFLSVGTFVVDGTPIHAAGPLSIAFWWARAAGPRHAAMRGTARWVQIGSWYPAAIGFRDRILRTDPMARFVDLEVRQVEPQLWRARLALATETVVAEIRSSGQAIPAAATEPGFMSVPMSGADKGHFTVYTYAGHRHRSAQGRWRASGTGTFADAFSIPGEASAFDTDFQEGWSSRSGLYRFAGEQPSRP